MTGSRRTQDTVPPSPPSIPTYLDPIPGIIPFGALVQFVGPPKCGKTALLASWLQRLRDGQSICGLPTNRPPSIGIITTDHKWALNQGIWFDKAGYPDVRHVALRDDPKIKWATLKGKGNGSQALLDAALAELNPAKGGFVALDVAGPFISPRLNDYNEVLAGIGGMGQVFDRYQLTGLLLGHMGKQKANPQERYLRPHERILGSGALIGFTDTTMYLLGPEDTGQPFHTFGWLPTHAPEGTFRLHQNSHTGLFEPYTGSLEPDEARPELTAFLEAIPIPPVGFRAAHLIPLIMAGFDVKERRAWDLLNDMILLKLLRKTDEGLYVRVQEPPYRVQ